jgi:hypothetical protein
MPLCEFVGAQSFDPETLDRMYIVFLHVCASLGLTDRKAPATEIVAEKVIELGGCVTRDADQLRRAGAFNLAR